MLFRPLDLAPDSQAEPVEQVKHRARIASGQSEGLAAGVGEDARHDALGRASTLVLLRLVTYEQVEEALHAVLHV